MGSPIRGAIRGLADRFVGATDELLGLRLDERITAIGTHPNEAGFDPFGFDPAVGRYALAAISWLYRCYFRVEASGIDQLPKGRALIVANHSGQLPFDGMMIAAALMLDAEPPRVARGMVEKWSATLPFVSVFFARCGQVVGSPDNAARLLEREETLLVFPEGVRGIAKPFSRRYELSDFGLGFMRLALATNTPIVPVAVVGGEEQYISVADFQPLARMLGVPVFPILPQLMLGLVAPLPTKYRLHFGAPMRFEGDPDDEDVVIEQKVWSVQAAIRSLLHQGLETRRGVFT